MTFHQGVSVPAGPANDNAVLFAMVSVLGAFVGLVLTVVWVCVPFILMKIQKAAERTATAAEADRLRQENMHKTLCTLSVQLDYLIKLNTRGGTAEAKPQASVAPPGSMPHAAPGTRTASPSAAPRTWPRS